MRSSRGGPAPSNPCFSFPRESCAVPQALSLNLGAAIVLVFGTAGFLTSVLLIQATWPPLEKHQIAKPKCKTKGTLLDQCVTNHHRITHEFEVHMTLLGLVSPRQSIFLGWRSHGLLALVPVFFVATGLLFAGHEGRKDQEPDTAARSPEATPQTKSGTIPFQLVASGRGIKKGALNVSFNHYKSTDNVLVYYSIESYASKERARAEMENMVKHSNKVIARGRKRLADGALIGARAVLVSTCEETGRKSPVIVWTDKTELSVLCSESMKEVLAFEQLIYSEKPRR